jgi:hypothetical protein
VNTSHLSVSSFIQPCDDFFHRLRDELEISPLVASNRVSALLDDVAAVSAGAPVGSTETIS